MNGLTPRAIAARRAAIDQIAKGNVEAAFNELAMDLRHRPATPEQALFLGNWSNRNVPDQTLTQMLASALLADGDLDGALGAIQSVTERTPDSRAVLMTSHPDLAAFCRTNGFPSDCVPGYGIEPVSTIDQSELPGDGSFLSGLPSGLTVGGSFAPASSSGLVFWNRAIFNPNRAVRHDASELLPPLVVASSDRCLARIRDVTTHGPAVLMGDSGNFGHWLLNHVARLALIDNRPDLKTLPLVIGHAVSGFVPETLALVGRDPNSVIRVHSNELAQFEMLWIPDMPFCGKLGDRKIYLSRKAAIWIRNMLGARSPRRPDRRIFVSRAGAKRRRIINEQEVFECLKPLGFERIDPANLSVRHQSELASESICIAGGFGAGMAITYLAPPETRVVEISHPTPGMRIQKAMCHVLGQHYMCVDSRSAAEATHRLNDDVIVEPASVLAAVKLALQGRN